MKKYIPLVLLALGALSGLAQERAEEGKTLLYLMPFYGDRYDADAAAGIRDYGSLSQVPSFRLMGFWNGAQLALDEADSSGLNLNVIVRDVTDNDDKLRGIMEDKDLMNGVDLIVGPFFMPQFTLAAGYAKKYGIPIVNPFTNRTDILNDNEYVYKLIPSKERKPAMLAHYAARFPQCQILIWSDTTRAEPDRELYTAYFDSHGIRYETVPDYSQIAGKLKDDRHNIIIALKDGTIEIMLLSHALDTRGGLQNLTLVVPMSWMESNIYDVEYYSKLNVHLFSDYYVNPDNPAVKDFVQAYKYKYLSPPTLENFAFQGYDITRYFISWLYQDMDFSRVKVDPLSYYFSFNKIPGGGYENSRMQFLEIVDNDAVPVDLPSTDDNEKFE